MKTNLAANNRNNAGFGPDSTARNAGKTGIDYKSLLAGLPLTPEKMKKSNDSIENALFLLGKTCQEDIQDYPYAINTYDSLLAKFPTTHRKNRPCSISFTAIPSWAIRRTPTGCWNY